MDNPGRSPRTGSKSASPARATASSALNRSRRSSMIGLRPRSILSSPSTSRISNKRPGSQASTVSDGLLEQTDSPELPTPVLKRPRFRKLPPPKPVQFLNTMKALQEMKEAGASADADSFLESNSSQSDIATPDIRQLRPQKRFVPGQKPRNITQIGSKLKEALEEERNKNAAEPSGLNNTDLMSDNDDSDSPETSAVLVRPRFVAKKDQRRSVPKPNLRKALEDEKEELDGRSSSSESDNLESPALEPWKKRGKFPAARKEAIPAGELAAALEDYKKEQETKKLERKDGKRVKEMETDGSDGSETPDIVAKPRYSFVKDKRRSVPKPNLQQALEADKDELDELVEASDPEKSISPTFVPTRKRGVFPTRKIVLPPGQLAVALEEYKQQKELEKMQQKVNENLNEHAVISEQNVLADENDESDSPTDPTSPIREKQNTSRKSAISSRRVSGSVNLPVPTTIDQHMAENLASESQNISILGPFQAPSQSTPRVSTKSAQKAQSSRPPSCMSGISVISAASTYLSLENIVESDAEVANAVANAPETANAGSLIFSNDQTASGSARNPLVESAIAALASNEKESTATDLDLSRGKGTLVKQMDDEEGTMVKKWTRPVSRSSNAITSRSEKTVEVIDDVEEDDIVIVKRSMNTSAENVNTTGKEKTASIIEQVEDMEVEDYVSVAKIKPPSSKPTTPSSMSFQAASYTQNLTKSGIQPSPGASRRSGLEEEVIPQEASRSSKETKRFSISVTQGNQDSEEVAPKTTNNAESQVDQNLQNLAPLRNQSVSVQSARRESRAGNESRVSNVQSMANLSGAFVIPSPAKNNISAMGKSFRGSSSGRAPETAEISQNSGNSPLNTNKTADNANEPEKATDSESLRSESIVSNTTEENPELVLLMSVSEGEEMEHSGSTVEDSVEGGNEDEIRTGNVQKPVPAEVDATRLGKHISATNVTLESILANLEAKKPGWASTPMVRSALPRNETAGKEGTFQAENVPSTSSNIAAGPRTSGLKFTTKDDREKINAMVDKLINKPSTMPKLDLKGLPKNFKIPTPAVKQTSMKEFLSTLSPQMQKHMNEISPNVGPEVVIQRKSVALKRSYKPRKPQNEDPQPKYVTKGNLAFYSKTRFSAEALDKFHAATAAFTDEVTEDLEEFLEYKNIPALRHFEDVFELTLFQGLFKTWREYADFVRLHMPHETCKALVPFDVDIPNSTTSLKWTVKTQKRIEAMERQYAQVDEDEEDIEEQ